MMDFRKIVVILVLAAGGLASAEIVTVVDAVETTTANISMPTSTNGRLMFRPCAEACEEKFIAVRLTPATTFSVSGQAVDFLDFRKAFFNMRRGNDGYALVSYNIEDNTVTSMSIGE